MKFTEILEQFRTLGGTANNIELRYGKFGRGLFPINPRLPVQIKVPAHLLVSSDWLYLNNQNHLRIKKSSGLDQAFIAFYEAYQQHFGWSVGGLEELISHHHNLSTLSKRLQQYLLLFGWLKSDFDNKSIKNYLNDYFIGRQIRIENESRLMPILELINHSADSQQYQVDNGVSVSGKFKTEVFTCYHGGVDALHFYRNYHFPTASNTVLSCDVKIEVPKLGTINISRLDAVIDIKDGIITPKIIKKRSEIRVSFLELTSNKNNMYPRKLFAERMQPYGFDAFTANSVFEGLLEHNRKALADLINECKLSYNKIAKDIELIATSQLKLLE